MKKPADLSIEIMTTAASISETSLTKENKNIVADIVADIETWCSRYREDWDLVMKNRDLSDSGRDNRLGEVRSRLHPALEEIRTRMHRHFDSESASLRSLIASGRTKTDASVAQEIRSMTAAADWSSDPLAASAKLAEAAATADGDHYVNAMQGMQFPFSIYTAEQIAEARRTQDRRRFPREFEELQLFEMTVNLLDSLIDQAAQI
jgi:hypothetical protein